MREEGKEKRDERGVHTDERREMGEEREATQKRCERREMSEEGREERIEEE